MIIKRLLHSLSFRLQSVSIFLSLVGLFFGVKSYIHIKHQFGEEASFVFYDDLMLQIGVAIVVNAIVAYVLYKIATHPIKHLGETMRMLTENDLKVEVPYTDEPTEIGSMARKVQIFKNNAIEKDRLERQHLENEKRLREEKSKTMSELANHFESRVQGIIKEVVHAATDLKSVSEKMSGVIGGVSSKATSVENVAGQTSQNVSSVASSAEEMSISVHDVADQIAKSTQAVHAAVDAKDRANEVSRALETAAGKIGEIVDSIQKIAGQINLLALNAMIESARAGEAGKGFAVVANEVKMLATATTTATEDISNHVVNIQDVSSQVIKSLEAINTAIQSVDSYSSSIAATIKQQTAATNEIASNMTAAAGRTKQIVTDISEVKQASAGANESANHVFEAVKVLYVQTEKLSKEVVGFLGEIRAA